MPRPRQQSPRPPIIGISSPPAIGPAGRVPVTPQDPPEDPDRHEADPERLHLRNRLIRTIARQIAIDIRREHATTPGKGNDDRC